MILNDAIIRTLSHPQTLPAAMQNITVTLNYTSSAIDGGIADDQWLSFETLLDAMNVVLSAGLGQSDSHGRASAHRHSPDKLIVSIVGTSLEPCWIAFLVRLVVQLHHAPYHPLMEITGAKPAPYETTVEALSITISPSGHELPFHDFLGIETLPILTSAIVPETESLIVSDAFVIAGKTEPNAGIENALLELAGAFAFQPTSYERSEEPEFYQNETGDLTIASCVMDQAALVTILDILPNT